MANWQQYGYAQTGYAYSQQQYPLMEEMRPEEYAQYAAPVAAAAAATQSYDQYYSTPAITTQTQPKPPFTITQYASQAQAPTNYHHQSTPIYYNQPSTAAQQQRHVNQADPRQNRAPVAAPSQNYSQTQSYPQTQSSSSTQSRWGEQPTGYNLSPRSGGYGSSSGQASSTQQRSQSSGQSSASRSQPPQQSASRSQSQHYSQRSQSSSQSQQPRSQSSHSEQRRQPPAQSQHRSQGSSSQGRLLPTPQERSQLLAQLKSQPSPQKGQPSSQPPQQKKPQAPPPQQQQQKKPQPPPQQQKSQPPSQQQQQQKTQAPAGQKSQASPAKAANKSDDMEISDEEDDWQKCDICNIQFTSEKSYRMHCSGMLHAQKVATRQAHPSSSSSQQSNNSSKSLTKGGDDFTKDDEIDWTKGYFTKGGVTNLKIADVNDKPAVSTQSSTQPIVQTPGGGKMQDWHCQMCDKRFLGGNDMWQSHISMKPHCKLMLRYQLEHGFKGFKERFGDVQCGLDINVGPIATADEVLNYTDVPANEKHQYREFVYRCGIANDFFCSMCSQNMQSLDKWVTHVQSKKHFKKFIFYLTKIKETAEDFWAECGSLPGVYPGKIRDAIPTEGVVLKDWLKSTFKLRESAPKPLPPASPFEGSVTQLKSNIGVIGDSTYFDLSLAKDMGLQLRDRVKGMRIASPNPAYQFKAVKMERTFGPLQVAKSAFAPRPSYQPPNKTVPGKTAPPPLLGRPGPGDPRAPRPSGDPRGPPPTPRDPQGRPPYPPDYYRRPPHPHDPYYDYYYRRPPHPHDPYYRPPHPHDPYYRPPGAPGADGKPGDPNRKPPPLLGASPSLLGASPDDPHRRPYPEDPYYRPPMPPPHPEDPYRRPYPDDPYYRPPYPDPYYRPPYPPHPDDPYRRGLPDQVEIPGMGPGYTDFSATPGTSQVMFSAEELKKLQETLRQMEAAKDDPFKQLALAAQLRILQEKQKQAASVAKGSTSQTEALKKLEGVMSPEEMGELKKALYKIQAAKKMGKEGKSDGKHGHGDDRQKRKGDRMPPWRAPKGEGKPWEQDSRVKDAPWESDDGVKNAPWEDDDKDKDAPWEDEPKPMGRQLGYVPDAPWETEGKPDPWQKPDDGWTDEKDDDPLWRDDREQDRGMAAGGPPGRMMGGGGPPGMRMPGGPPRPWNAGNEDFTLMTPDVEAKIRARRKLGNDDGGVALITPEAEAKIREARMKKEREAKGGDARNASVSKDAPAPWDKDDKGKDAPWDSDRKSQESPWDADRRSSPAKDAAAPWDSELPRRPSVSEDVMPWNKPQKNKDDDDFEAKILEARKRSSSTEAADPWKSGGRAKEPWGSKDESPERRAGSSKPDPWRGGGGDSPRDEPSAPGKSDPWRSSGAGGGDAGKDNGPSPWDAPSSDEPAPWQTEKAPVVAPWEQEAGPTPRNREDDDGVSPWNQPGSGPASDAVAPWETDRPSRRMPSRSPPRPVLPAEAPWEKNNPKKKQTFTSGGTPPWAAKAAEKSTGSFADVTEAEEFGVSHDDVQAAKLAPWNRAKVDSRDASPAARRGIVRFDRERSGSRDSGEDRAPWEKKGGVNKLSELDFSVEDRPPSPPDSPARDWELLRGVDEEEQPPWTVKSSSVMGNGKRQLDSSIKDTIRQFLGSYEDFHGQGGSHLSFDQLSPEVRDVVSHIQDATYNDVHDVISTVHLLLALDPGIFQDLAQYDPAELRDLVETHSTLQIQALEILSVSVKHIVDLHTAQGRLGGGGGKKRRADPWGEDDMVMDKRPRF